MANVQCPNCATINHLVADDRSVDGFCSNCDFPLFWTTERVAVLVSAGVEGEDHAHRLPGVAGRVLPDGIRCPNCEEPNPLDRQQCFRCHHDLYPAPKEEPVVADEEQSYEPLEPFLVKAGTRALLAATIATGLGLAGLLVTVAASLTSNAEGAHGQTLDATSAAAYSVASALPSWTFEAGMLSLGLLVAGFSLALLAVTPHVFSEAHATDDALPVLVSMKGLMSQ